MKGSVRTVIFGLLVAALCAACSKQPAHEINAAKSAVDAAVSEGAEKYAPAEAQKVNEELAVAMAEVRTQDGKFFRDYKKSREMLLKVKADAGVLEAGLDVKKTAAGKRARIDFEAAKAAVDAAKSGVLEMPKGLSIETETIRVDLKGLDESLAEVSMLIKTEDYLTASDNARSIKGKAADISEEIQQAKEEAAPRRAKKKWKRMSSIADSGVRRVCPTPRRGE